jgi:hypothetical protein
MSYKEKRIMKRCAIAALIVLCCVFSSGYSAIENMGQRALIYAHTVATTKNDDSEHQYAKKCFLCCAQESSNDDGETILHSPYSSDFCTKEEDAQTIFCALHNIIATDACFFESLFLRQDNFGNTPIHTALSRRDAWWLCMLLQIVYGFRNVCSSNIQELLTIRNNTGQTIFDLASAVKFGDSFSDDALTSMNIISRLQQEFGVDHAEEETFVNSIFRLLYN